MKVIKGMVRLQWLLQSATLAATRLSRWGKSWGTGGSRDGDTRKRTALLAALCGAMYYLPSQLESSQSSEKERWDLGKVVRQWGCETEDALYGRFSVDWSRGWGLQLVHFDGSHVLSKAQADVLALWNSVPREHSMLEKPRVTLRQDTLCVQFSLVGSLDATRFLMEIAQALSRQPAVNYTMKDAEMKLRTGEEGVSSVIKFDCVQGDASLAVQITIPISTEGHPEIEICKKGELVDDDLSLLRMIFQATTKSSSSHASHSMEKFVDSWFQSQPDEDDPFEELENRMREFMEGFPFQRTFPGLDTGRPSTDTHQLQVQKRPPRDQHQDQQSSAEASIQKLETMGAVVYRPNPTEKLDWGILSGYEIQKRRIEDGLLLPLLHPDVSESIAKRTRKHFSSNRPRGVLFEGPPGTGKTTSARLIASQAAVHLIYLPLESILSKWYGESEKLLSEAFKLADQLGGSILFFDEIETLGAKRNDEMHEASRRVLSVLLLEMDGFDLRKKIIVIGATNRKQDVDPALLSRFDSTILFDLPDRKCRELIFRQYAQQLKEKEIEKLARETEEMSGRDIRDICESTERSWASRIVRGEVPKEELPDLQPYLDAVAERHTSIQPPTKTNL